MPTPDKVTAESADQPTIGNRPISELIAELNRDGVTLRTHDHGEGKVEIVALGRRQVRAADRFQRQIERRQRRADVRAAREAARQVTA